MSQDVSPKRRGWIPLSLAIGVLLVALAANVFYPQFFQRWAAVPNAAQYGLQFNGFYRDLNPEDRFATYMRFFNDGRVLIGTTDPMTSPEQVMKWFDTLAVSLEHGSYKLNDMNQIEFSTTSWAGVRNYKVSAQGQKLDMVWRSSEQDKDHVASYEFVPVP